MSSLKCGLMAAGFAFAAAASTASAGVIVVRPFVDGDAAINLQGNGSGLNTADFWLFSRPRVNQQNERRALFEMDAFSEDPWQVQVNTRQPNEMTITKAVLTLSIDNPFSGRGTGTYDIYGYNSDVWLTVNDVRNTPNRVLIGSFTADVDNRLDTDFLVDVELDPTFFMNIWNVNTNRLTPGFQVRAREGAPRLAIDSYNYPLIFDGGNPTYPREAGPKLTLTFKGPVSEPATLALAGAGLLGLAALRRRR